jgi:hypothetical protein
MCQPTDTLSKLIRSSYGSSGTPSIQKQDAPLVHSKEVLCRWGTVEEIVADNGTAFVAMLE